MTWLAILLAAVSAAAQPPPAAPPPIAFVGATVWPGDGPPIENATLVIRDGRVVSLLAGGAVPAGATRTDAAGRVITPGFIATEAPLGLVEISLEESTDDDSPEGDDVDPVRAAFTAADGFNPRSTLIPVARTGGVTTAVITPEGGLVSGTSTCVDLEGTRTDEMTVRAVCALHVHLDDAGVAAAGGARPAAISRLRELLDDARLYGRQRAAFDRRAVREMRVSRLDLERLQDVLARRIPMVVRVSRASDILRVLDLARTYNLRLILSGAEEAWLVADRIAAAGVPVILQPLTNLPSGFATLGSRYDNATLLRRAGARVIITTAGAHNLWNLRQEAGNAIATGVTREDALRALTIEPARAFGIDADHGTLAPGRVASFTIWSGDPFELSTRPTTLYIRGREVSLRTRQSDLFDRYRDLARVRRGRPASP
jgi:imidazolonepropionase-like amidohydrolase